MDFVELNHSAYSPDIVPTDYHMLLSYYFIVYELHGLSGQPDIQVARKETDCMKQLLKSFIL